jgi:hypothetical protein
MKKRLDDLDYLVGLCSDSDVVIYADEKAYKALSRQISFRTSSKS